MTQKRSSLVSLPPELLDHIGPNLDTTDVASIRSTCTSLAQIFAPYLTDSFLIAVSKTMTKTSCKRTKITFRTVEFISAPESLVGFIRHLLIDIDPVIGSISDEEYGSVVGAARVEIARFRCLRSLRITWLRAHKIGEDTREKLFRVEENLFSTALRSNNWELEDLELTHPLLFYDTQAAHPLPMQLTSLKKFAVYQDLNNSGDSAAHLTHIIANNPALQALEIYIVSRKRNVPLQEILPRASRLPLGIHTLALQGEITISPGSLRELSNFLNLRHLTLKLAFENPIAQFDAFWDVLRIAGVPLQSLQLEDIRGISPALVAYLTSYQGLHYLSWTVSIFIRGDASYAQSREPIHYILQSQAPSLHTLNITVPDILTCIFVDSAELPSLDPSCFLQLETLRLRAPPHLVLSQANLQKVLNNIERFPALIHAFTFWGIPSSQIMERSHLTVIAKRLIATTGRPKIWDISGWCLMPMFERDKHFKIQRQDDQSWKFVTSVNEKWIY